VNTCENCGLASWSVTSEGVTIQIQDKPENRFQRTRKRTVWCHSDECAIQCLGLAKYGKDTSHWPITLAQFRATKPLEAFRRPKPPQRVRASQKAKVAVWGTQNHPAQPIPVEIPA
jgi:muramoyltetrapeptide carboxypeptidase LdcA involved in peptidoglycan recycling